jgi:ABC-type polysaccharide/polyol phosphate export permease
MTTLTGPLDAGLAGAAPQPTVAPARRGPGTVAAVAAFARRRLALSARTPRELLVPVLTPLLFALIIAPALSDTLGGSLGGIDYMTFVAVSTLGLLVPLSAMSAGLGVLVDRLGGAQRDLLAAPVPRALIVVGNLAVSVALSGLQVAVVVGASALRGAEFEVSAAGVGWFVAAALGFAVAMYGVAEILANRLPTQEEYIGALPAICIVPWFVAGSLFPISALPVGLTAIAKVLPLTHVLALLRYGLVDRTGQGLHDIWGMESTTAMAGLSLAVVVAFAVLMTALSFRVFRRSAVQ